MIFGSVCSGIGGIDLGLEAVGMQCAWQIEREPFCQSILAQHWPEVSKYGDIHDCNKHNLSPVDVLAGGIPCQPHSYAGKRRASADNRDLWGEFYRLIRELRPRYALLENVPGFLSSEKGRYFGRVLRQLAKAGYMSEWFCLRASDFGAPHRRERVFVVAHDPRQRSRAWRATSEGQLREANSDSPGAADVANASSQGLQEWNGRTEAGRESATAHGCEGHQGQAESRLGRGINGHADGMDTPRWPAGPGKEQHAWEPPRVVYEKVVDRVPRLKALGNSCVWMCAAHVGAMLIRHAQGQIDGR